MREEQAIEFLPLQISRYAALDVVDPAFGHIRSRALRFRLRTCNPKYFAVGQLLSQQRSVVPGATANIEHASAGGIDLIDYQRISNVGIDPLCQWLNLLPVWHHFARLKIVPALAG
ncbi:MAG: hypothetical protein ABSA94_16835 [Acidobacteriaceae bacterium]